MTITIDMIKQLREATAAGMGACKEALAASNGDMDEAVKYLREKGLAVAAKRVDKESKQGIVALAEAADKKSMGRRGEGRARGQGHRVHPRRRLQDAAHQDRREREDPP